MGMAVFDDIIVGCRTCRVIDEKYNFETEHKWSTSRSDAKLVLDLEMAKI